MPDRPAPAPTRWRRNPAVLWRRTLDAVVLLDPTGTPPVGGDALVATGPALPLWLLLATPLTLDELADSLADLHGLAPDTVAARVRPVLADLADRHLVVEAGS